ncbi:MAG: YqaE/Pmp3 family membrane protein [Bacteroidia bacterium]
MYRMLVAAVFALCVAQGAWAVAPGGGMGGGGKAAQQHPQQEGALLTPAAQAGGPVTVDVQQMEASPEAPIVENTTNTDSKKPIGKQTQPEADNAVSDAQFALLSKSHATKKETRQQLKNAVKNYRRDSKSLAPDAPLADDMTVLLVILCFFIPPLAVGLYEGITTNFWISLILTLCFFLPGVIFSLLVVLDVI